jgi:hypothetical protein
MLIQIVRLPVKALKAVFSSTPLMMSAERYVAIGSLKL